MNNAAASERVSCVYFMCFLCFLVVFLLSFLGRTLDVRPPARLKGERNEIEKLMAGWCVTTCSPNFIWEAACRTVGETLTIGTGVVRQTRTARTKDQAGTTNTNHARHPKRTRPKRGNQNRRESITLHLWRTVFIRPSAYRKRMLPDRGLREVIQAENFWMSMISGCRN